MNEKLRPVLWFATMLLLGIGWLHFFHDPSVRATEKLREQTQHTDSSSHQTDTRVARLAADSFQREAELARLDVKLRGARGEIARLKAGTIVPILRTDSTPRDSLIADAFRRDTLEDQQDSVIANQLSELTIWKALAVERGDLLTRALSERDAYKKIAASWQGKAGKRFGCAGGPGVVASLDGHVSAGVGIACGIRF